MIDALREHRHNEARRVMQDVHRGRYSDIELVTEFEQLFPQGFAGEDVLRERGEVLHPHMAHAQGGVQASDEERSRERNPLHLHTVVIP